MENLIFNNKKFKINIDIIREDINDQYISYEIIYKKSSGPWESKIGVIDTSRTESFDDYLECTRLFLKNRRFGKIARRWFNRELKPLFESYGFNINDLYSGKIKLEEL